jgi:A/G-specific adenine glycosylase
MNDFSAHLTHWYNLNKRNLPWRSTHNPYAIWLSEIILQQTRVDQGLAYYEKFLAQWPDIFSFANASEQEVLRMWQGLGYYSRARNMLQTAKDIVENYNGTFPSDYHQLMSLKGIGPYTAAAIASISFNKAYPVVDGNVIRVLSRIFGVTEAVDSKTGRKRIEELALILMDQQNPGTYNQAIMEFGALQCVPSSPNCEECIFRDQCYAYQAKIVKFLPLKEKKTKVTSRYFNYLLFSYESDFEFKTIIRKRLQDDIWKGLFEFPLIESLEELDFDRLKQLPEFVNIIGQNRFRLIKQSAVRKHVLSHQKIYARFYHLHFDDHLDLLGENNISLISQKDLQSYPLPRLIDRYLHEIDGNL